MSTAELQRYCECGPWWSASIVGYAMRPAQDARGQALPQGMLHCHRCRRLVRDLDDHSRIVQVWDEATPPAGHPPRLSP